jgi:hypothetical protein
MRPDKKKKVHHDSQKCKNRALASNNNPGEDRKSKTQKSAPHNPNTSSIVSETKSEATSSKTNDINIQLVESDNDGSQCENKIEDTSDSKDYSRRKIESNWAKYEIPLTDDEDSQEETTMTGLDFNYVIENSRSSDSMFRLKAEKEWEEKQTMFTNEIFSLDLTNLEKAVACVPLHVQLDISKSEFEEKLFCPKAFEDLTERAKIHYDKWAEETKNGPQEDIECLNERLVSMLISKPEPYITSNNKLYDSKMKSSKRSDTEHSKINKTSNENQLSKNDTAQSSDIITIKQEEAINDLELDQLLQVDSKSKNMNSSDLGFQKCEMVSDRVVTNQNTSELELELDDILQDNFEKASVQIQLKSNDKKEETDDISVKMVSDQNLGNETKKLEDWLDDFLSD